MALRQLDMGVLYKISCKRVIYNHVRVNLSSLENISERNKFFRFAWSLSKALTFWSFCSSFAYLPDTNFLITLFQEALKILCVFSVLPSLVFSFSFKLHLFQYALSSVTLPVHEKVLCPEPCELCNQLAGIARSCSPEQTDIFSFMKL